MAEHPHDDPEHPGKPPGDPDHPAHPHGAPPGQGADHPDAPGPPEAPAPTHPIVGPDDADVPEPTPQTVEPALGLGEFVAVQPMRMAARAALRRWMTLTGHDPDGHYPLKAWQTYYQAMLAHH